MAVISLRTGEAISSKHSKQLMEEISADIEHGLVSAVVVVTVYRDGASDYGLSIDGDFNADTMIGAIERAKSSVLSKIKVRED